jgi:tetratricopeptide (TPR) repeat protein
MDVGPQFKVKIASGRILGPLDLERVRQLILKNQIVGTEIAREYPRGDWVDINSIPLIAELLVARAEGRLSQPQADPGGSAYSPLMGDAGLLATQVLPGAEPAAGKTTLAEIAELKELGDDAIPVAPPPDPTQATRVANLDLSLEGVAAPSEAEAPDLPEDAPLGDDDRTAIGPMPTALDIEGGKGDGPLSDGDATMVTRVGQVRMSETGNLMLEEDAIREARELVLDKDGKLVPKSPTSSKAASELQEFKVAGDNRNRIATEKTVVFQRSAPAESTRAIGKGQASMPKRKRRIVELAKATVAAIALGIVGYQLLLEEEPNNTQAPVKWEAIRPVLPSYSKGDPKPEESNRIYMAAMKDYVLDNVAGYRSASKKLLEACSVDPGNVKALAMLASTYLNLIDSSNKDESYFVVISKLIEMSRAKNVDLPETVIADVEFFIMANKAEAAENRIVDYTKSHPSFGAEMYYYLGLAFFQRGDIPSAARYLGAIPDNKAFSAKVFYLRGLVAEKLSDFDSALKEYDKAVRINPAHARSRLRISALLNKRGTLKEAAAHLDYLVTHISLLAPKEMGEAYFLHAQLSQAYGKPDIALGDMERAARLDKDNHDYLLELYTLRAKAGDASIKSVQHEARMYFFLGEGEKLLKVGKHHDALVQFMQASSSHPNSPLPLVKIGDMFRLQNDIGNAMINYRKAAQKAPNSIEVWSKYINTLILSFEWDEARKAIEKFRNLPVPQSSIDKLVADWFAKQNQHKEAQEYYRKAMARDTVDPDVYIAYAKSLMATKHFKEAPFFFALALRFDPLNVEAILGTAKCIAATDSIDRAISLLQDELGKSSHPNASLLSAIAELFIQKGEWERAQQSIDQAKIADPELAQPWRLQAQVHLNRENTDKTALDKAAAAYQSYSERNPSDPSGYIERYNIHLKKTEFEKAEDELAKVFALFPKYPRLHFYKGWLYGAQGNHKLAAEEYKRELQNNPGHVVTMIALGKALIELGQVGGAGGAQELFTKAMQLAPTNPEAKHQAGYAAYLLKNYAASVALYRAALVYDKANPMIYKRMGMAYRDMGDGAGAAASFQKYIEMEPDAPDRKEFEQYR